MDGHFVPNISIGPLVVKAVRKYTALPLDVHLMISEPSRYIKAFVSAGADILTIHTEAVEDIPGHIETIKATGIRVGLAINPGTSIDILKNFLPDLDMVTVMSVEPGFGGQAFIPESIEKIMAVRRMADEVAPGVDIEVDGGVTGDNAAAVIAAGADILVAGSAVFNGDGIAAEVKRFLAIMNRGE